LNSTSSLEALQRTIAKQGLELFIVSHEESIQYLTGVSYRPLERPFFILVYPAKKPDLLVPVMERDHLAQAGGIGTIYTYWDYPAVEGQQWKDILLQVIRGNKIIGVEPTMPVEIFKEIIGHNPLVMPLVEEMRLVKSPPEIEMLRHAARYAMTAVKQVIASSYYGVSLLELFSLGRNITMMMLKEVGYDAVLSSVLVGAWPAPGSAMPHNVPSVSTILRDGPHIALALIRAHGYCAECERTYFLSPPSPEVQDAFAAMNEARRRAFELLKPGVTCREVDEAANGYLRSRGFGDKLLHRTGHGFGLSTHEGPWIAAGCDTVLEPNMLVSIEPGIYPPGLEAYGIQIRFSLPQMATKF
jgi:Xaa-Pro aminopeptidase